MVYVKKLVAVNIPSLSTQQPFTYGVLVNKERDYLYFRYAAEELRTTVRRQMVGLGLISQMGYTPFFISKAFSA